MCIVHGASLNRRAPRCYEGIANTFVQLFVLVAFVEIGVPKAMRATQSYRRRDCLRRTKGGSDAEGAHKSIEYSPY